MSPTPSPHTSHAMAAAPRRRALIRRSLALALLLPFGPGRAALPWPRLPEDDFAAQAVDYHLDGSAADPARYPAAAAGTQRCGNCRFFHGGPDTAWAQCPLFPERHVSGAGWCRAWTALDAGHEDAR